MAAHNLHPGKRLPAPAVHSYSTSQSQPSSLVDRITSKPFSSRSRLRISLAFNYSNLYRFLIVIGLLSTASFLLSHYSSYILSEPSLFIPSLLHLSQHTRRVAKRTLRLYQRQLHLHPLLSRAITAGVIFFIADFLAQVLNRRANPKPPAFSFTRLLRYTVYGLIAMGPFLYLWYALMNEYGPEDDISGSLIKCIFEQITLEPICISMYIIYDGFVCRRGWSPVRKALDAQFFPLWFKNAVFWLPANFANYYIGTPDLRVVFANLCSLFWNIYFSSKVNKMSVPSFVPHDDKDSKYLQLSSHDRQQVISKAGAYQTPPDAHVRRVGDLISSPRVPLLPV
ncbi:unnamed protein product [Chondrus crispus]|uniref:Uncharacterized protein n=1 Tax=Chondrus crispus TaxID=2769 RepID=R7QG39_CHOCR|nr:unnamed protein product [Chondrus crispus]CDF36743.1 unnamed protein product [Chondrus crispus]|eukprot:XP_005716562.1 unnamed protein product [Chondrus crispus]